MGNVDGNREGVWQYGTLDMSFQTSEHIPRTSHHFHSPKREEHSLGSQLRAATATSPVLLQEPMHAISLQVGNPTNLNMELSEYAQPSQGPSVSLSVCHLAP